MRKPNKWFDVYPYGTKEGDEEAQFFRALCRHEKFEWISISAIIKKSNLTRERVEEIIDKYANRTNPPLVYASPTQEEHWGYWERCPDILKKDERDVSKKDKDNRVDKHISGTSQTQNSNIVVIDANSTSQTIAIP